MQPVLFEITFGDNSIFTMSSYRFFGLLAALYLLAAAWFTLRRHRLPFVQTAAVLLVTTAAFFVGSRLLFAVLYLPNIVDNPATLVKFKLVNFTLHGGLAAALLAWWLVAKILGLSFFRLTDRLAPHAGIAAAVMRLGCFLNGCCFGKVTAVPWGISFPRFSLAHLAQIYAKPVAFLFPPMPVHPTQLYEMAAALTASLAAWLVLKKSSKKGLAAAVFGLTFTTGRLIVFFYREFPISSELSNMVRGPVVYGLAIAFFSTWLYRASRDNKQRPEG